MGILNILMFVMLYPVMLIVYFVIKVEMDKTDPYLYGACMKKQWLENPEIKSVMKHYKSSLKWWFIFFAVVPFITIFIKYDSIDYTIWMAWMTIVLCIVFVQYSNANKKVRTWKKKMGYNIDENGVEDDDRFWRGGMLYYNQSLNRRKYCKRPEYCRRWNYSQLPCCQSDYGRIQGGH